MYSSRIYPASSMTTPSRMECTAYPEESSSNRIHGSNRCMSWQSTQKESQNQGYQSEILTPSIVLPDESSSTDWDSCTRKTSDRNHVDRVAARVLLRASPSSLLGSLDTSSFDLHRRKTQNQHEVEETESPARSNSPLRFTAFDEIPTRDGSYEQRHDPQRFFRLGMVFCQTLNPVEAEDYTSQMTGESTDAIHTPIRRFVVIREGRRKCDVVPIHTYGNQGVGHPAVVKSDHAIIFTGRKPPNLLDKELPKNNESPLRPDCIRVRTFSLTEKLSPYSRLNLGKVYSIDHTAQIRPFGTVTAECLVPLLNTFQAVWMDGASTLHLRAIAPNDYETTIGCRSINSVRIKRNLVPQERLVRSIQSSQYRVTETLESFYKFGKILSTLWFEPNDSQMDRLGLQKSTQGACETSTSANLASETRNFVVIEIPSKKSDRYTALCIKADKANGLPGIDMLDSQYGLVCFTESVPRVSAVNRLSSARHSMSLDPIHVKMTAQGERLSAYSYIDYKQHIFIDPDTRVRSLGHVLPESQELFWRQYLAVQSDEAMSRLSSHMKCLRPLHVFEMLG